MRLKFPVDRLEKRPSVISHGRIDLRPWPQFGEVYASIIRSHTRAEPEQGAAILIDDPFSRII
jgi:hypothetical protein